MANIEHLPEAQYLAGEREAEIAEMRNDAEYIYGPDVVEMRICEIQHLFLKPNQKYIFTVDETCEGCVKAASAAAGA
jgi:hypothetical protein